MKAAIIGAGFIADFHAAAYARLAQTSLTQTSLTQTSLTQTGLPQVSLVAVCDLDEARGRALAQAYGCAWYAQAEDMLEKERPQLVSICLPTFLHARYTLLALGAGAHVLCEKPLALTWEECSAMAGAARSAGRLLMAGQVLRFWPEYQVIANEIQRLGKPRYLSTQRLQHASRTAWLGDPKRGGGALFDLFIHDLDYICSLLGAHPQIEAVNGSRGTQGAWGRISASLRWPGGTFAHLEACNQMPPQYPFTANFRGEYEAACLQYSFRAPVNIQRDAKTQTAFLKFENGAASSLPIAQEAQSQAFHQEVEAFCQGVAQGHEPIPLEETLGVMALLFEMLSKLEAA